VAKTPESAGVELNVSGAVVVRPGDHLVVGVIAPMSVQEGEERRAEVMAMLPGVEVTLLSPVSSMAVYRPDDGRTAS
jgi:hypothetical protein